MKKFKKIRVKSRLSRLLGAGKGITANEAIARADAVLRPLRASTLEATDQIIAEIERRFGRRAAERASENLLDLYMLCTRIIDLAVVTPEIGLHEAARALCDLIDLSLERERTDWVAVDLHLEVLHLLRAGADQSQAQRDLLLAGLQQVTMKRLASAGRAAD